MLPRGNASVRVPQAEKRRAHMAGLGGFLSEADTLSDDGRASCFAAKVIRGVDATKSINTPASLVAQRN